MSEFYKIELDKNNRQYLYIQLYNQIKKMILDSRLKPYEKLPTIRELAQILNINAITVVSAYNLLEKDQYIYKKVGSGTFIQDIKKHRINETFTDDEIIDYTNEKSNKTDDTQDMINFGTTAPTSDLFPVADFKEVLNKVLDRDKGNAFIYQESQGYYPLREAITNYLKNFNIESTADNIQIISGAQQGLDIISKALIDYGDVVFTESPTYAGAIAVFKSRDAKIVEIDIEADGINLKELENKLKSFNPKFLYIMPNLQTPTGCTYSEELKLKLLKLAYKHDFYIIEDDYLSDLYLAKGEKPTLKSLDKHDRVIYLKSFSKIFMPGLRLAFMVIPSSVYNNILMAKHTSDISTSSLIQRAFHLYLTDGAWQRHIEYIDKTYKERFKIMVDSLQKYLPEEVSYNIPNGGLSFWLALPHGYSSNDLYNECLTNKIIIAPGSRFYVDNKDSRFFRLSISSIHSDLIPQGILKLSGIISSFIENKKNKQVKNQYFNNFI